MTEGNASLLSRPSPSITRALSGASWRIGVLFAMLLLALLLSLTIGRYPVPIHTILKLLLAGSTGEARAHSDPSWVVVYIVRMPRVLLVSVSGINLGLAGAAMQGLFRNPLVGPEVVGVSAGASLGGVIALMCGWSVPIVMGSAFLWGFGALLVAIVIAKTSRHTSILALLLSGVIVGAFFGALTGLAEYLADPQSQLPEITYWLLGSFVGATYIKVLTLSIASLIGTTFLLLMRWRINLLSLEDNDARALGIHVEALRWLVVVLVSLLAASQVAVSGGIAFVGLIIPHAARLWVGPEHSQLLPASALLGGCYLLLMDDISRTMFRTDVPIGLLTSCVGAPIFGILFWKSRSSGWGQL